MIDSQRPTLIAAVSALLLGAALLGGPLLVGGSGAAPTRLDIRDGRYVSAWLPFWKVDEGLASFTENADLFTDITTFFHYATGESGALEAQAPTADLDRVIREAHSREVPALAAVLDDTPPGTMARILSDPATRAEHIAALLKLVDDHAYDGIDIDYERFAFSDGAATWPQTRANWVAFINELSVELHDRGKHLTVAVPPMFDDDFDGSSGFWVYDWPAIAPSVDVLRVMTYDYSTESPGPIAPLPWVEQATSYGVATMGPQKFRIGVPTYGRNWVVATSGDQCEEADYPQRTSLTASQALQLAERNGVEVQYDETNASAYFSYQQVFPGCTVDRVVHFSDARAVGAKADLAVAEGTGVALWSLGGEDPATWDALRAAAAAE